MNKNQIFIKSGTEYKKMTKELLTASNLAELIGDRHKMVGIKPNLVSPSDPSEGGTTHPEIIAGILEYLTLQTTRLSTVITLADTITQGILGRFSA